MSQAFGNVDNTCEEYFELGFRDGKGKRRSCSCEMIKNPRSWKLGDVRDSGYHDSPLFYQDRRERNSLGMDERSKVSTCEWTSKDVINAGENDAGGSKAA